MSEIKVQSGLIVAGRGTAEVVHDLTIPSPEQTQVVIRVRAVALNTPDILALDSLGRPGAGLGFDFAGEISEIKESGSEKWKIGDRVAGFVHACHGANYSVGAFRQYVLADKDLLIRIPESLSFPEACSLGMGVSTASQALYQSLPLPLPEGTSRNTSTAAPKNVLIYGASSATGMIAVQLAKLSGLRVIATCSASKIPLIKSLGADEVVDYKGEDAVRKIQALSQEQGIQNILDCIANSKTARFCYQCFKEPAASTKTSGDFIYASLMPVEDLPDHASQLGESITIHNTWNMVYTCFGRRFTIVNDKLGINKTWEPSQGDLDFMVKIYGLVGEHLKAGALRTIPIEKREGGLDHILDGIEDIRQGRVHGEKLVYCLK